MIEDKDYIEPKITTVAYKPVSAMTLIEATDALNHMHREMSILLGFNNYHKRDYKGGSFLVEVTA